MKGTRMKNTITIANQYNQPNRMLELIKGYDKEGNLYEVDNLSFMKNKKRFYPIMGEFHYSRYEADYLEEEIFNMQAG